MFNTNYGPINGLYWRLERKGEEEFLLENFTRWFDRVFFVKLLEGLLDALSKGEILSRAIY